MEPLESFLLGILMVLLVAGVFAVIRAICMFLVAGVFAILRALYHGLIYGLNYLWENKDTIVHGYLTITAVVMATCVFASFTFITWLCYTTLVFGSRNALRKTALLLSTATTYTICLVQSVWYGIRCFNGEVGDPTMFWTLVLLDTAVFSIVTKRADLTHKRTRKPMLSSVYFCFLLVPALVFTCLRLWCDPIAWKLVSEVASKSWPFFALWTSPLLFEYLLIPEYSEEPYSLLGPWFPSLQCDVDPAIEQSS